jgi:hypothetical protein
MRAMTNDYDRWLGGMLEHHELRKRLTNRLSGYCLHSIPDPAHSVVMAGEILIHDVTMADRVEQGASRNYDSAPPDASRRLERVHHAHAVY